jgi:RNA polymerase sigma factor (sigma-70 family)
MPDERRGPEARESSDETWRLALAAKEGRDHASDELVAALMPRIRAVARGYRRWPVLDESELMQEGVVGVLRALERFDPGRNIPFWAYASWWVRQAMQRQVAELTGSVVLSDRALRQLARVKAAHREHVRVHGAEPTARELEASTGLSSEQIGELTVAARRPRGLKEPIRDDAGSATTFEDQVADPSAEDAYEQIPAAVDAGSLPALLDHLSARERTVVRARFGFEVRPRTLRELGGELDLSAERVRQIEERALQKLRAVADATA